MKTKEQDIDMELSKSIDELVAQYLPEYKKSKASEEAEVKEEEKELVKSEDKDGSSKKEESDSKKSDDKDEDDESDEFYNKKSLTLTEKGLDLLKKAVATQEAEKIKAEQAEIKKAEEVAKSKSEEKADGEMDFKKSIVQTLADLQEQIKAIAKRPVGVRKSITTEVEAIEKAKAKEKESPLEVGEVAGVLQDMLEKGQVSADVVCEFDGTKEICDPMVKSRVIAEVKKRRGLK